MNSIFFVDIVVNFLTAYYDEDFVIIDQSKVSNNSPFKPK
jgi:hypothetical protein